MNNCNLPSKNEFIELYLAMVESLDGYHHRLNKYKKYRNALKYWMLKDEFDSIEAVLKYVPHKSNLTNIKWHTRTKNKISLNKKDNCANLYLRNVTGDVVGISKIDYGDIVIVSEHKWSLETAGSGYAMCGSLKVKLHRFLLGTNDSNISVDHINSFTLDNRRKNLRDTDHHGNMKNIKILSTNTTGVSGISKLGDKYRVRIRIDSSEKHIGVFESFDDAVIARLNAEIKYYGQYAPQLHLCEKYNIFNPYTHLTDIRSDEPSLYEAMVLRRLIQYKINRGN